MLLNGIVHLKMLKFLNIMWNIDIKFQKWYNELKSIKYVKSMST